MTHIPEILQCSQCETKKHPHNLAIRSHGLEYIRCDLVKRVVAERDAARASLEEADAIIRRSLDYNDSLRRSPEEARAYLAKREAEKRDDK